MHAVLCLRRVKFPRDSVAQRLLLALADFHFERLAQLASCESGLPAGALAAEVSCGLIGDMDKDSTKRDPGCAGKQIGICFGYFWFLGKSDASDNPSNQHGEVAMDTRKNPLGSCRCPFGSSIVK